MRRRLLAIGLLECVFGLFLLTAGILCLFQLFHRALQHQSQSEQLVRVATAADNLLEEIAGWASQVDNFSGDWSAYQDRYFQRPEAPEVWLKVHMIRDTDSLLTPSSGLEKAYGAEARKLRRCLVQVCLEAGSEPLRSKTLWRFQRRISAPRRGFQPELTVTAVLGSSNISRDNAAEFEVQLLDSSNHPIPDVTFFWELKPITGNGVLENVQSRDGHRVKVTHHYIAPITYVDGEAILVAHCRYFGEEISHEIPILFQP